MKVSFADLPPRSDENMLAQGHKLVISLETAHALVVAGYPIPDCMVISSAYNPAMILEPACRRKRRSNNARLIAPGE